MKTSISLIHDNCLYFAMIDANEEVSFGSGKKDDVKVPDFVPEQVVLTFRHGNLSLSCKEPFRFYEKSVPTETAIILNETDKTYMFLTEKTEVSSNVLTLPYDGEFKLGRSIQGNDIVIGLPYISSKHMRIVCKNGEVRIEDLGSTHGTFVNGRKILNAKLKSGDVISILGTRMIYRNNTISFVGVGETLTIRNLKADLNRGSVGVSEDKMLRFHASPRMQEELPSQEIVIASPPSKGQKYERSRGMASMLAGSGAMLGASMLSGSLSPALLAARGASLVSPVTSVVNSSSSNKKRKRILAEYDKKRKEMYAAYAEDQKAIINAVAEQQRRIITQENPSPKDNLDTLFRLRRTLWERMPGDRDFLDVRVGMGYENLCVPVKAKSNGNGFQMEEDETEALVDQIIEDTSIVDNVPLRVPLVRQNTIGFVGERTKTIGLVRNMLISLLTVHKASDVRVIGIFDSSEKSFWQDMRWLPHLNDDEQNRFLSFDEEGGTALCDYLADVISNREKDAKANSSQTPTIPSPYYIVIFGSKWLVEKHTVLNQLFSNSPDMGITSLFLFDEMYQLPPKCRYIVDLTDIPCVYEKEKSNQKSFFTLDPIISNDEFSQFARRMAAVKFEGFASKAALPKSITFLEGYGVKKVEDLNIWERWNSSSTENSLAAPIGKLTGDETFYLDIHEKAHGPHGLVAGTTGSGKSEILQTWILSLACTYHPHAVNFVLIDFKGGGLANLLDPLPHVVGKITNLGTNISRTILSLKSEQNRRQLLFDKYGVNHIDKYQRLYKQGVATEPLPHLIIVSDEFAQLKKEEPAFLDGLIAAARIGRSLGIHLVLATQKPAGVVDEQIQSNTRFRLCLKVQDATDSREMLKRPDAARLVQAGRAYIRVGEDEYFDLLQSYWSGADYGAEFETDSPDENCVSFVSINGKRTNPVWKRKPKKKSDRDELSVIVEYIVNLAERKGIQPLKGPWLPELPEQISLDDLHVSGGFNGDSWDGELPWLSVPIGMYDMPQIQQQGVQKINFAEDGHLAVYGAAGTGKTTFLKSLVTSLCRYYTPDDVNIYIIDCGGWGMSTFSDMPHVGGVALDSETEKIAKLENMIRDEFARRKKLFLSNSVNSLVSYRETVRKDLPAIFIVVDNMIALFTLYQQMEDFFCKVSGEGATYGIYLVYSANTTTGVRYKVVQNMKNAVAFELTDKADYPNMVGRPSGYLLDKTIGRAYAKGNPPTVFQAAMFSGETSEKERNMAIRELMGKMNDAWEGNRPMSIPVMPELITPQLLNNAFKDYKAIPIGLNRDTIQTTFIDLHQQNTVAVAGANLDLYSEFVINMASLIRERYKDAKFYVIDAQEEKLRSICKDNDVFVNCSDDALLTDTLSDLQDIMQARFDDKEKSFIQNEPLICLFINDLKKTFAEISDDNYDALKRLCRNHCKTCEDGLKFISILSAGTNDYPGMIIDQFMRGIQLNRAIALSGTLAENAALNFKNVSSSQVGAPTDAGFGYYFSGEGTGVEVIKYMRY